MLVQPVDRELLYELRRQRPFYRIRDEAADVGQELDQTVRQPLVSACRVGADGTDLECVAAAGRGQE